MFKKPTATTATDPVVPPRPTWKVLIVDDEPEVHTITRLTLRDGKPRYLADAPRFIQYIRHTCNRYGVLKPLMRLIDEIEDIQVESGYQFGR